jgi:hypothetical protein
MSNDKTINKIWSTSWLSTTSFNSQTITHEQPSASGGEAKNQLTVTLDESDRILNDRQALYDEVIASGRGAGAASADRRGVSAYHYQVVLPLGRRAG